MIKNFLHSKHFFFMALAVQFLCLGCGLNSEEALSKASNFTTTNEVLNLSPIDAFSEALHPTLREGCANCHGQGIGPQFAAFDITTAFEVALRLINREQTGSSRIVIRSQDGHCGGNCVGDGTLYLDAIERWLRLQEESDEEIISNEKDNIDRITESLNIPINLNSTFQKMSWNLANFGPDFDGVLFEFEIQQFNSETYRIRNPRLLTQSNAIEIRGVHVLLNGTEAPQSTAYTDVNTQVNSNQNQLISNRLMLLLGEQPNDQISIAFDHLAIVQ